MEQFNQLIGCMSPCQVQSLETVDHDVAFENWNAMGDAIPTVQKHRAKQTLCEKWHQRLHSVLNSPHLELLEHQLRHPSLIGQRVQNGLCQKH